MSGDQKEGEEKEEPNSAEAKARKFRQRDIKTEDVFANLQIAVESLTFLREIKGLDVENYVFSSEFNFERDMLSKEIVPVLKEYLTFEFSEFLVQMAESSELTLLKKDLQGVKDTRRQIMHAKQNKSNAKSARPDPASRNLMVEEPMVAKNDFGLRKLAEKNDFGLQKLAKKIILEEVARGDEQRPGAANARNENFLSEATTKGDAVRTRGDTLMQDFIRGEVQLFQERVTREAKLKKGTYYYGLVPLNAKNGKATAYPENKRKTVRINKDGGPRYLPQKPENPYTNEKSHIKRDIPKRAVSMLPFQMREQMMKKPMPKNTDDDYCVNLEKGNMKVLFGDLSSEGDQNSVLSSPSNIDPFNEKFFRSAKGNDLLLPVKPSDDAGEKGGKNGSFFNGFGSSGGGDENLLRSPKEKGKGSQDWLSMRDWKDDIVAMATPSKMSKNKDAVKNHVASVKEYAKPLAKIPEVAGESQSQKIDANPTKELAKPLAKPAQASPKKELAKPLVKPIEANPNPKANPAPKGGIRTRLRTREI
jgi:hypothetical protein